MILLDSWSGHNSKTVNDVTPNNKLVLVKTIPSGTTGRIQPLDVFGFRVWKNFVRQFSDKVLPLGEDINLHLRNNIIKIQSLTHNQLSSPWYRNLFLYAWFKCGHTLEKPGRFDNPVEFILKQSSGHRCEAACCTNFAAFRCSWCKKYLCFLHFFMEYHFCQAYQP